MIHYVTGDATAPIGSGKRIIVHLCNDAGKWGKGFVLALSKRWPQPEAEYRSSLPKLGSVQFTSVEPQLAVANVIALHGIRSPSNPQPIDMPSLMTGLLLVADRARVRGSTIHMPRIGAGLGGETWETMEAVINKAFVGIDVYVYTLPSAVDYGRI